MPEIQKIEIYKNKVIESVNQFLERDVELLELEAHEQAISHRIAVYLERKFRRFNVDCEYNRNMGDTKKLKFLLDSINLSADCCLPSRSSECAKIEKYKNKYPSKNTLEKSFRPDIIVHLRRSNDNNEIIIEIKKTNDCNFDKEKLKLMTKQDGEYAYKLGVFIRFEKGTGNNWLPHYTWFVDGAEYQF